MNKFADYVQKLAANNTIDADGQQVRNNLDKFKLWKGIGLGTAASGILAAVSIGKLITNLRNDVRRKALIDDLYLNDPVIRNEDKGQIYEWYATIMHFAPNFALDRAAVKEVLYNCIRFGKIDMQTLSLLAKTEKDQVDAQKSLPWGDVFGRAVGFMS